MVAQLLVACKWIRLVDPAWRLRFSFSFSAEGYKPGVNSLAHAGDV